MQVGKGDNTLDIGRGLINFRDTTIENEIASDFCMGPKDLTVIHKLRFKQKGNSAFFISDGLIKEKILKDKWTYCIPNIEKYGF